MRAVIRRPGAVESVCLAAIGKEEERGLSGSSNVCDGPGIWSLGCTLLLPAIHAFVGLDPVVLSLVVVCPIPLRIFI